MAEYSNLESILATLAAQKTPASSTPPQNQPPSYPPPPGGYPTHSQAPGVSDAPGTGSYPYPQPTTSGSLDLSAAVQPTTSGSVSIQEAIARAKAHAAQNGVTPYDRPVNYAAAQPAAPRSDEGRYRSSRSRSPPARRSAPETYRDSSYNPYRDERRDERRDGRDRRNNGDEQYESASRGRDRFSPRGNSGGRPRSPPRGGGGGGGDDSAETIEIPANLVGLIIGRQGENLKRVEGESQCRVQFLAAASPDEEIRQCKITGQATQRALAKAAIFQIVEDNGMGTGPRGAGGRGFGGAGAAAAQNAALAAGQASLKEGEECVQIMVPDRTVGLIIGRGGETIRDLQERSGCHINIVGETKSVNGLRPVNLIGGRVETNKAKELIMEIVDSDTRNTNGGGPPGGPPGGGGAPPFRHGGGGGGYPGGGGSGGFPGGGGGDRQNDSIFVPAEAVGMIIGKGGETIREMQTQTGCKINVSQTPGANENEREIGLIGSLQAIEAAKVAIEDKVEAVRQKNSGGGGRGGRGGGGGGYQQRDYESQGYGGGGRGAGTGGGYGQPASAPSQPMGSDDPNADPYAAYGGYAAYVAMWYQALQQQQGAGGAPGEGA